MRHAHAVALSVAETFEWPINGFDGYQRCVPTVEFIAWLWDVGERDFPNERLNALYQEWCCHAESRPVKLWELQRQLTAHGVERYRQSPKWVNGKQYRPMRYKITERHASK